MGSEAVMQRPAMDYSMGRSFTAANSTSVRKYANAPIVNKIEEYVQVRGCEGECVCACACDCLCHLTG
jgi:hypothetical protein